MFDTLSFTTKSLNCITRKIVTGWNLEHQWRAGTGSNWAVRNKWLITKMGVDLFGHYLQLLWYPWVQCRFKNPLNLASSLGAKEMEDRSPCLWISSYFSHFFPFKGECYSLQTLQSNLSSPFICLLLLLPCLLGAEQLMHKTAKSSSWRKCLLPLQWNIKLKWWREWF